MLLNVYAPNYNKFRHKESVAAQISFLEEIIPFIEKHNDCNYVLGGDWNTLLDPQIDKYNPSKNDIRTDFASKILSLCEQLNLIDIWRVMNPGVCRYTWRSRHPLQQSRLDFWLISAHMIYDLKDVDILPAIHTDHSIISVSFQNRDDCTKGAGFWKFPSHLLKDKDYVAYIKEWILISKEKYLQLSDLGLKWDLVKMEIRTATIGYSKTQARLKKEYESDLIEQMKNLEIQIS